MDAIEALRNIGVTDEMIVEISGTIADMPHGYDLKKTNIKTGQMVQVICIYPNQPWSDGTCRPIYGISGWDPEKYNVRVYLNTRV